MELHKISSALSINSASIEMDDEIKKLSDNLLTISRMIKEAEDELVQSRQAYSKSFLTKADALTPAEMNVQGISKNTKGSWIERMLYDGHGSKLDLARNRIKYLERTREDWREMLLAYKKLRDIVI